MGLESARAPFVLAFACLAVGCGAGTEGRRVSYEIDVASSAPGPSLASFQTSAGYGVTLQEACLSLGPAYFFAGPSSTTLLRRRLHDLVVPSAHAHPGVEHFAGGEVRGEWLTQLVFDAARGATVELGRFEGTAGPVRAATVELHPLRGPARGEASCLRGHQAYVVGTARRGSLELAFEGGLDIADEGQKRVVAGLPVDGTLDDDVRLRVEVDPRAWLDGAQFDRLTATSPAGRALITADSQVYSAWFIGVRSARAFRVVVQRKGQGRS